jgi:anti-anti-sigma factor
MNLETEQLEGDVMKVNLFGRMDITGVEEIGFLLASAIAVERRRVIVDLSGVDFMSSIGVRAILQNARALKLRGGAIALTGAGPLVAQVLDSAGVGNVMPIAPDLATARAALTAQ